MAGILRLLILVVCRFAGEQYPSAPYDEAINNDVPGRAGQLGLDPAVRCHDRNRNIFAMLLAPELPKFEIDSFGDQIDGIFFNGPAIDHRRLIDNVVLESRGQNSVAGVDCGGKSRPSVAPPIAYTPVAISAA